MSPDTTPVRRRFHARGTVQGVGFRPTVHRWAHELGLVGWVANAGADLVGELEGSPAAVAEVLSRLCTQAPPGALVRDLDATDLAPLEEPGFTVRPSLDGARPAGMALPADRATCAACLDEVLTASDRRFHHAFASCTACGPRLTIATGTPFDRERTTMADFELCEACALEHADPSDRRFHAVATCCPACGPTLRFDPPTDAEPIEAASAVLRSGGVVAVKGLGGHQLAALASDEGAVARVRAIKDREHKPLALLVVDVAMAEELCVLDDVERQLLVGPRGPIVLARRRRVAGPGSVAHGVAPGTDVLGIMVPATPLHHLLARAAGAPLVLTSANPSDEPMLVDDDEAVARLGPSVDGRLGHDRRIAARVDDSVARVVGGRVRVVRRARGWAPEPIRLGHPVERPTLAVGADLKSTVCLAFGHEAHLSTHLGDLAHPVARDAHLAAARALVDALGVVPEVIAHDLHPGYASTAAARCLASELGAEAVPVQHHLAHVVACLAEHDHPGPALGLAFDGLGHGTDGTAWGGELLLVRQEGSIRLRHLRPVPMPGGTAAAREGWRMAVAHLQAAGIDPRGLAVHQRHAHEWEPVARLAATGTASPLTSSVGRLFDAVAALCGAADANRFEGDAASALEQLADRTRAPRPGTTGDSTTLLRRVVEQLRDGVDPGEVAAAFHDDLVAMAAAAVGHAAATTGVGTVALGGGAFQNARLLSSLEGRLRGQGLTVLSPSIVPANDGGISLGQAVAGRGRWTLDPCPEPSVPSPFGP